MERSMLSGKSFLLIYWPRTRLKGPKSFFIHDSLNHLFFGINKNFLCIFLDKLRSIHYHQYDYDAPIDEYGRQELVMLDFVLQLKSVWGLGTSIPHFFFFLLLVEKSAPWVAMSITKQVCFNYPSTIRKLGTFVSPYLYFLLLFETILYSVTIEVYTLI